MTCHLVQPSRPLQRGLSLVELLVAMTIGVIVIGGLVNLLTESKSSYTVSERITSIQENGRFALHVLAEDIRLAKHWGLMTQPGDIIVEGGIPVPAGECAVGWSWDTALPITGFNDVNGYAGFCINNADYSIGFDDGGTDILVIRHVDTAPIAIADIVEDNYYLHSSVADGMVFAADADGAIDADAVSNIELETSFATQTNRLVAHAYYIRPCSDLGANNVCDGGDDGGNPIPTLVRETLQGATVQAEPLVEFVEDMQIQYGLDVNGDFSVDQYLNADQIILPGFNWAQVIAVRIELMVRASGIDAGYINATVYTIGDKPSAAPPPGSANFRRTVFRSTVFLRNQAINTEAL